jgi:transcriptional regulator with XRE-family HTH domain
MPKKSDRIIKRIKNTRKSIGRSRQDCAKILGISTDTYRSIEKGETPFTLPQLELLSVFLKINLSSLFEEEPPQHSLAIVLNDEIRPHYLVLRNKMIRAMLSIERENQSLTLENIAQDTHIPLNALQHYDSGEEPIPMDDLLKISDYLGVSIDMLYEPLALDDKQRESSSVKTGWQPEFNITEAPKKPIEDDPYMDLFKAFRRIPTVDQAHIAKTILEKIKQA